MSRIATRLRLVYALAALVVAAALSVAVGANASSGQDDEIVIGASIPLSGWGAAFGGYLKWGYEDAVEEVNKRGGVTVDGKKRKIRLILLDDKSDPNVTSANVQRLVTKDNVVALLSSASPELVVAADLVAERYRKPVVGGACPIEAFTTVRKWKYSWVLFFSVKDLFPLPFQTMKAHGLKSNKRVAILHDNGTDGIFAGKAWSEAAKAFGYDVVYKASFPANSTNFSALIRRAQAANAEILLADSLPPQAIALTKQMEAADYHPKWFTIEKGSEPDFYPKTLGKLADAVTVGGFWHPTMYKGGAALAKEFEAETKQTWSQHIADTQTAAMVLFDAIDRAGTTDADKINAEIAKTNKVYSNGRIKFRTDHAAILPLVETQWQKGKAEIVGPSTKGNTAKVLYPRP